MNFAFPEAWWVLCGLFIPLIIHFLSKKKKKIVDIGSISFLQPSESASSKSLFFSDLWLLLVRAFIIAFTVFLTAKLLVPYPRKKQSIVFAEEPIAQDKAYQSLRDQWLDADKIEYFTLDPKTKTEHNNFYPSAYSLIAALNQMQDSITVYTHSLHKHFIGSEVHLRFGIRWVIVPNKNSTEDPNHDLDKSRLSIHVHQPNEEASKRLVAIIESLKSSLPYQISWSSEPENTQLHISTDAKQINIGTASIRMQVTNHPLSINHISPSQIVISGELSKEELLHSNLPVILAGFCNKIVAETHLNDRRTLEPKYSEQQRISYAGASHKPIQSIWWILLGPIILLERYLSYKSIAA